MKIRTALGCLAAALIAPAGAAAHVTVNPTEAPAEAFFRFAVRVPTERENASTVRVSMQLPEGLFFVSFQPKAGWKRTIRMERLAEPVEVLGEPVTERVASVTWTATRTAARIRPGEFDEFGMSARIPETVGEELMFPAVQRYASGEVVRWIDPDPEAESPAPRVTVLPPAEEEEEAATEPAAAPAAQQEAEDDSSRENLALGLGGAGLVAGLAALGVSLFRRRPA